MKLTPLQKAVQSLEGRQREEYRRELGRLFFEYLPAAKLAVEAEEEGKPEKPTHAADRIAWQRAMEEALKRATNGSGK